MRSRSWLLGLVLSLPVAICFPATVRADLLIDVGGRTVNVHEPPGYDPQVPAPVVILLHGYTASGAAQEAYMQLEPLSDEKGFLFLHPDGTVDCIANRFWNGTDACCDLCSSGVDDVAFLTAVIDAVEAAFNVDPARIHLMGHSNGGFMSYRMACDLSERIASIASLAGATWDDPADCAPAAPVHVLQIHGTSDDTILYDGGSIQSVPYPGALQTVESWASSNGCSLVPDTSLPSRDLDASLPGSESTVARYATGCAGAIAELWTIPGGEHVPDLSATFSRQVVDWLLGHPKASSSVLPATRPGWLAIALAAAGLASLLALSGARRAGARAPR